MCPMSTKAVRPPTRGSRRRWSRPKLSWGIQAEFCCGRLVRSPWSGSWWRPRVMRRPTASHIVLPMRSRRRSLSDLRAFVSRAADLEERASLRARLLQSGAETNVHARSFHCTHFATCASHQERTCTCVPAEVREAFFLRERRRSRQSQVRCAKQLTKKGACSQWQEIVDAEDVCGGQENCDEAQHHGQDQVEQED